MRSFGKLRQSARLDGALAEYRDALPPTSKRAVSAQTRFDGVAVAQSDMDEAEIALVGHALGDAFQHDRISQPRVRITA